MVTKDQFPLTEKLSDAKWNSAMDALESYWLSMFADAQTEYQEERMRLIGNSRGSVSPGIAIRDCLSVLLPSDPDNY